MVKNKIYGSFEFFDFTQFFFFCWSFNRSDSFNKVPLNAVKTSIISLFLFIFSDRKRFFNITLGSGILVNILVGFPFGLTFSYFLLLLCYSATAFATLQLYFRYANEQVLSLFLKMLCF